MTLDTKTILKAEDLAALLKVSATTLARMRRAGKILHPLAASEGQKPRWLSAEVVSWLEAGTPSAEEWRGMKADPVGAK